MKTVRAWIPGLLASLGVAAGCGGGGGSVAADGGRGSVAADGGTSSKDAGAGGATDARTNDAAYAPDAPIVGACSEPPCQNPIPLIVADADTGIDDCEGGGVRRRAIVECPSLIPRPQECHAGNGTNSTCVSDTDCTSAPNGYCEVNLDQSEHLDCSCLYGCLRDSDCASGSICVCRDVVGSCFPASCSSGDSCSPGCDCVNRNSSMFVCQSPMDR
jgi:hypothetical protein